MVSDVPEYRTTRLWVSSTERMLTRRSPLFVICDDQSISCRWESHKSAHTFIQRAHAHQEIAFCWSWMTQPTRTQLLSALYHLHTYILLYPVSLQKKTSFFSTFKDNAKTSFGTDTVLRIPYIKFSTTLPFFERSWNGR